MADRNIADIYPLSPLQQGMLFHSLYAPQSGAYIVQMSYEILGELNITAFEQAWQEVINRHSILRSAFVWDKLEKPLQVVGRFVKAPIIYLDWQNISESQQQQQLIDLLQQQRQQGFNLSKAPLMSLTLIQMADNTYQFIWSYHHLLLDGWSIPLLIQEYLTFYHSFCQNQTLHLEQPRPYRDYIAWLQQQNLQSAEHFWQQNLQGFTTPTSLGIEKSINLFNEQSANYQEQQIQLSPELTAQLQSFARQYQLTLNTLIQGAYALLLSCYSGENDIVFGATCSGRPTSLTGSELMIGLFINTLPVRIKVFPQVTLISWLQQLQREQIERQQYEYSPLVNIHRASEVPQNLPLFNSLVIFENYPVEPALKQSLNTLDIRNIRITEQTNYPLTLYGVADSQLSLQILYDTYRFDADSIERLLGHLETLLTAMVSHPEQQLSELSLLTQAEKETLLIQWNQTQAEYPKQCLHQLIEQQVEKSPDAVAVVFEDEQLTYKELNQKANQLAHYLQKWGIKAESLVGIALEPSLNRVIALLAILKAGGAYLPLDPNYPTERLAFMLQDARVSVLLTQESGEEVGARLPRPYQAGDRRQEITNRKQKTIALDKEWEVIRQESQENPKNNVTPENLAYIIYTSGSTGQPKGVQILHKSVVNFLTAMQKTPGLTAEDTLLSVTSLSFDIAALELFLPLIVGAKVVLVSRQVASNGIQLLEKLQTSKATVMQATPATWQLLIASGWQKSQSLKILSGGEALTPKLAQELLKRGKQVWNLYGPTETTIWSSVYHVREVTSENTVFIGRPIANTQCYVLDKQLQPLPIGVAGELHIAGEGVARGYLNRPELTAEKFINHPFIRSKLYKTGDLVRYLADGNLEYLGRIDYQVKLRGFRLELGEIEKVLIQHPKVREAVVIIREDEPDNQCLVAYIVGTEGQSLPDLRTFLAQKLPSYMIPTAFVELETFPLTPNGKIDRKSLPLPDAFRLTQIENYVIPHTEMERTIAGIWQKVLQLEKIGIHDNFFELGGHSLLLIKVHSQLREHLATDISLVDLFRYPTISSLTEYFSQLTHEIPENTNRNQQLEAGKQRQLQRRQQRAMISNSKDLKDHE